jgi:hypothetical protein
LLPPRRLVGLLLRSHEVVLLVVICCWWCLAFYVELGLPFLQILLRRRFRGGGGELLHLLRHALDPLEVSHGIVRAAGARHRVRVHGGAALGGVANGGGELAFLIGRDRALCRVMMMVRMRVVVVVMMTAPQQGSDHQVQQLWYRRISSIQ